MKTSYVQDPLTGKLVPKDQYVRPHSQTHMVMPDIQPYQSMIDGSMISSRSVHRDHLRQHGCIEVGNEKQTSKQHATPQGRKEAIHRALSQVKR